MKVEGNLRVGVIKTFYQSQINTKAINHMLKMNMSESGIDKSFTTPAHDIQQRYTLGR